MDTPTLPTSKPIGTYRQMPANLQHVIDFDQFLHQNGWIRKRFNYYNKRGKVYMRAQELYPKFRNNNH